MAPPRSGVMCFAWFLNQLLKLPVAKGVDDALDFRQNDRMTNRPAKIEFTLQAPKGGFYRRMVLAWAGIFLAAMAYCLAHGLVMDSYEFAPDVAFKWALTKWGAWPLLLPLCFMVVRWVERRASLAVGIIAAAPVAMIGAGLFAFLVHLGDAEPWPLVRAFYHMAPVAGGTYLLFVALAFWLMDPVALSASTREAVAPKPAEALPVSKGQTQTRLPADQIDWVQAARNYVELFAGGDAFIMRASMKEMEDLLPEADFLRLHRSYLVNRRSVDGLRRNAKGDPLVVLKCGHTIPVGRAYRDQALASLGFLDQAA